MAFHCPACQEARVEYVRLLDDARSLLRCQLCEHEWKHGGGQEARPRHGPRAISFAQARAEFGTSHAVPDEASARYQRLKRQFLESRPEPQPAVAEFWRRYQRIFSSDGITTASPHDLKYFANSDVGARPGNMAIFNKSWNELGDAAAAEKLRGVIEYLLRGPSEVPLEDRLQQLIDPEDPLGMTGFRESLLTKVLCVVQPNRFLPILVYTSPAGGKREIARSVFSLELPAPQAASWTRGRLICWSNDLLVDLLGDGFSDLQHASQFLWWAKDQSDIG